jgi:hypothetical protein
LKVLRFAPLHIGDDPAASETWFKQHIPQGLPDTSILVPLHAKADRLNKRYRRTIEAVRQAVEAGKLNRQEALHLLTLFARDEEIALAWRDAGCPSPMVDLRAEETRAPKLLQDVRETAGRLAALLERGEPSDSLSVGIIRAARHTEEVFDAHVLFPRAEDGGVPPVEALAVFLREIARQVPAEPRYAFGRLLHHFQYGPLLLPKALTGKRTRLPDWKTTVLFGACMAARIATGSGAARSGNPRDGKPLRSVAAAFLADMLGGKPMTGEAVERNVSRLEDAGHTWMGWQTLRSDLATKGVILG